MKDRGRWGKILAVMFHLHICTHFCFVFLYPTICKMRELFLGQRVVTCGSFGSCETLNPYTRFCTIWREKLGLLDKYGDLRSPAHPFSTIHKG
jgi:hypothetical protein